MRQYQEKGFTYIEDVNEKNILTGTRSYAKEETRIKCFNGLAIFQVNGKNYIMEYPKIQSLTDEMKESIRARCGRTPGRGDYGLIAMTYGIIKAREMSDLEYITIQTREKRRKRK